MQYPTVIILAGGIGKNFAPLVTNKSVFPFLGKPLLYHTLAMIEQTGARKAIVVCNTENQALITNYPSKKLQLQTVLQQAADGQAQAVLLAARLIKDNEPVLIMNAGDLIEKSFLTRFIKESKNSYARIVGMHVHNYFPGGYLQIEGERVLKVIEKPAPGSEPSNLANLFFHYFSQPQDLFALLQKEDAADDAYEKALSKLMKKQVITYSSYDGYWQKLKQAHHVLDMTKLMLEHIMTRSISRQSFVDKKATIEGNVCIEAGAKILAGAVIKGPAYIGRSVVVGNHTLIRDSIIEEDSVIGFGSEVARSYIGPKCMLHHNFIGDSVLEAEVNPSYGTCTANLRFDGQKVRCRIHRSGGGDLLLDTNKDKLGAIMAKGVFLGVNCSILPGITLGEGATAYPSSVINKAVGAGGSFQK